MDANRIREIAENLDRLYRRVADIPERDPDGFIKLIELRNAVPDAVTTLLACAKAADGIVMIPEVDLQEMAKWIAKGRGEGG